MEAAHEPFAAALREAIARRGLGLHRLREHLRQRGRSVSVATLSYWQSGRSRPERQDSLVTLRHLEEVLAVPPGTLVDLLGPRRPRGGLRRVADTPGIGAFWPVPEAVEDAVRALDTRWDERLTRLSQQDVVRVGAHREELSFTSRQVLRAEADGPDRWVLILHLDEHDHALPEVRALRHCRVGRQVEDEATGLLVAELLFPRPLRRGETIITEHELRNRAPFPLATNYERKFRLPVREYVLEVRFDPAAPPARCHRYGRTEDGLERAEAVALDEEHSVHGVAVDFGPGCYGFRWTW
ncbi:transcriptional regulator with XRE-family HTH domain [Crossiella equi]|uniref:Transcriptional regulator with XRE-family HTH domain n=1 Tax=Crossiella equi TaxID=130796 RepID=A0ABS5AH73_9PSEU|nr:transcriptional regulator [Crossiella equi]MBP2475933.1 transcriptional regulator with XRE-family HTH domain [Crossiella equi]